MAEKRRNKGAAATVTRLWKTMGRQRIRLVIVAVSVIFYTVLSVAAPVYSAGVVVFSGGKSVGDWKKEPGSV